MDIMLHLLDLSVKHIEAEEMTQLQSIYFLSIPAWYKLYANKLVFALLPIVYVTLSRKKHRFENVSRKWWMSIKISFLVYNVMSDYVSQCFWNGTKWSTARKKTTTFYAAIVWNFMFSRMKYSDFDEWNWEAGKYELFPEWNTHAN